MFQMILQLEKTCMIYRKDVLIALTTNNKQILINSCIESNLKEYYRINNIIHICFNNDTIQRIKISR